MDFLFVFSFFFFFFEHVCLTKSGERGKTVKVLQLRKIRGSGTCECVVTRASSFVFYSFRNWELCLLNTGEPTYRHHSHHSFSVLGLSICDPSLVLEFDWLTHNDLCGSDHFPIILKTSPNEDEPAVKTLEVWHGWLDVLPHSYVRRDYLASWPSGSVYRYFDDWHYKRNYLTFLKRVSRKFNDACKQAIKERKKAQRKLFSKHYCRKRTCV